MHVSAERGKRRTARRFAIETWIEDVFKPSNLRPHEQLHVGLCHHLQGYPRGHGPALGMAFDDHGRLRSSRLGWSRLYPGEPDGGESIEQQD